MEFYSFLTFLVIIYFAFKVIVFGKLNLRNIKYNGFSVIKMAVLVFVLAFLPILINIVFSPLFNAKGYSSRIDIKMDGNFASDVEEVDFNHIPLLDKDSSQKLGDRVMGQLPELVSQFYVSDLYT